MSDKKEIVKAINAAFQRGDSETFLDHCAENIEWTMVGEKNVKGKAEIREWMKQMEGMVPPEFDVKTLIADGDSAACSGDMTMKDQNGKEGNYGYCDVYRFSGDQVSELISYVVTTDKKEVTQDATA